MTLAQLYCQQNRNGDLNFPWVARLIMSMGHYASIMVWRIEHLLVTLLC